jgi:hypothetical protein
MCGLLFLFIYNWNLFISVHFFQTVPVIKIAKLVVTVAIPQSLNTQQTIFRLNLDIRMNAFIQQLIILQKKKNYFINLTL